MNLDFIFSFRTLKRKSKKIIVMKNLIVVILLIAGIVLAFYGIQTYQESSANLEVLGMELSANDKSGQRSAIMYFALALASLAGGYFVWKKK